MRKYCFQRLSMLNGILTKHPAATTGSGTSTQAWNLPDDGAGLIFVKLRGREQSGQNRWTGHDQFESETV
jgi:hypothetical protein